MEFYNMNVSITDDTVRFTYDEGSYESIEPILFDTTARKESDTLSSDFVMTFSVISVAKCDCPFVFNFQLSELDSTKVYRFVMNGKPVLYRTPQEMMSHEKELARVEQTIWKLPEVAKNKAYLNEMSNGTRDLILEIHEVNDDPITASIWYRVIEVNGINKTVFYNFMVFPEQDYKIQYYDVKRPEYIDIEDWVKR